MSWRDPWTWYVVTDGGWALHFALSDWGWVLHVGPIILAVQW